MSAAKDYITECYICNNDYVDPRILPCVHTFCLECLENYKEANASTGETLHCPFCQKEFRVPQQALLGLKKNLFLERLVKVKTITSLHSNDRKCDECLEDSELTDDAVQLAVQYCVQCGQFLCKDCSRIHRKSKLSKNHSLLDLGTGAVYIHELLKNSSETIPCDKHSKEQVQMFCVDCNSFACSTCFDEGHQQHKIHSIERTAADFQNQLRKLIDDVSTCVTDAEKKIETMEEEMADFQRNTDDCKKEIFKTIEEFKCLVDSHGKALVDELLCTKQRRLKVLQNEVDKLQAHKTLLMHFKNYCSEVNSKATKSDLCDAFINLSRQAKELQGIHDSEMHAMTFCVTILFEKTHMIDQQNYNFVGKLKETVEVFVMQDEFGNSVMEDSENHSMPQVCEEIHETADTFPKLLQTTVQVSRSEDDANEPIFSRAQSSLEWKQTISNADASVMEPFTSKLNTESDWVPVSSNISVLFQESSTGAPTIKRTFPIITIDEDDSLSEPNNDDLINELTDRSTTDCTGSNIWEELEQDCFSSKVPEGNLEDITASKNSFSQTSDNSQTGQLLLGDFVAHPFENVSEVCPTHIYTVKSYKKALQNTHMPDYFVTRTSCDKLTSACFSDSLSPSICKSNYIPEVSQNSCNRRTSSDVQRNSGTDVDRQCREEILERLSGRQYNVRTMKSKTWIMQNNNKSEADLESFSESEPSTGDELPDLDIEETEQHPSCEPVTCDREAVSDPEENSCRPYAYSFPMKKYVNVTSDIGLRLVLDQVSEVKPILPTEKMPTSSNVEIQAADSTRNLKHKRKTSEREGKDDSKKLKGNGVLELIHMHKLKTGSCEVYGVTSLQNKVYVLRKKSVCVYSSDDPERSLTSIKLLDAITLFDICACKKTFAIYITDYAKFHDDRQKHCVWKITVSDNKVCRWYCGIEEPHTLSVNSAGNVILLRIEADSQQISLEVLSAEAELIRRICLPEEIQKPEHAVETSTGSFIICHKRNRYNIWTISEVNGNGEIVRRLKGTERLREPKHLALDVEDRIFVADWGCNRVAVLDAHFKWDSIFFATKEDDKDGFRNPTRLCCVAEKHQLIVVSNSLRVCVYRLR